MKIIYLHQYFNTPEMTGGTRSYEMARRLVARGHEVHVVTTWRDQNAARSNGWFKTEEEGIHVHWLPVEYNNRMSYPKRVAAFCQFAMRSARKAASLKGDLVFATSTPLTIALPGAYASRTLRVPMVFEVRDLWPEVPIAMGILRNPVLKKMAIGLERFAYRNSAEVVALSPGMRDGVIRLGFPPERVTEIPNSADLEFFDPRRANPANFMQAYPELAGRPLVVYTGTFGAANGVAYAVRLAAACRRRKHDICFALIGDGAELGALKAEATALGVLGKNLFIYPPVPKRSMPDVLASADLALSLFINVKALWANSANKFFDALASGTPIAINYGGWQAELLESNGAGLALPPEDPDTAAEILAAFLSDKVRLHGAARAARKLAEQRFSRDELAKQLDDVLARAKRKGRCNA